MREKTKEYLFMLCAILVLIYFGIAWYGNKTTCEKDGGIYAKGFFMWDCITIDNFKDPKE